jgi:uncharacterized membrane protein YdjX (TVP38/TMEM64 family)
MSEQTMDTAQNRRLKFGLLAMFGAGLVLFFLLGGRDWLSLENFKAHRDEWLSYTEQHYGRMLLIAGLVYIASTAFSIPGGAVLSLAIGFLFGRWVGTVLTVISASLGATLVFLAARFVFADYVRQRLARYPMAEKIIRGFRQNAFNYLLFLRLVPLFPFWLVNLAPALTDIDPKTYFLATLLGVIPGSFVYVNLGQSLGQIESAGDVLSFEVLLSFALLGLFALLPVFMKPRSEAP